MKEKELIKSMLADTYKMLRAYEDEVPPSIEDTYWKSVQDLETAMQSFDVVYSLLD